MGIENIVKGTSSSTEEVVEEAENFVIDHLDEVTEEELDFDQYMQELEAEEIFHGPLPRSENTVAHSESEDMFHGPLPRLNSTAMRVEPEVSHASRRTNNIVVNSNLLQHQRRGIEDIISLSSIEDIPANLFTRGVTRYDYMRVSTSNPDIYGSSEVSSNRMHGIPSEIETSLSEPELSTNSGIIRERVKRTLKPTFTLNSSIPYERKTQQSYNTDSGTTPKSEKVDSLEKFKKTPTKNEKVGQPRSRKLGKKRSRLLENNRQLELMADEDTENDLGNMSCGFRFSTVVHDPKLCRKVLHPVLDNNLDNITSSERKLEKRKKRAKNHKGRKSGKLGSRFMDFISLPLGMVQYLDSTLFNFFTREPIGVYISDPLSSFERMILHTIAEYYGLHSSSFNDKQNNIRLTKVFNRFKEFRSRVSLSSYLQSFEGGQK